MLDLLRYKFIVSATFIIALIILSLGRTAVAAVPEVAHELKDDIDIIDAQAFGPTVQPGLTLPADSIVSSIWARSGVVADGTSVLVIQVHANKDGAPLTVSVSTSDPLSTFPDIIGSLSATFPKLPAPDSPNDITDTTSITLPSGNDGVVFYRPPDNYLASPRANSFSVTVTATAYDVVLASTTITIYRPPIIFVHGIFSSPSAWDLMETGILNNAEQKSSAGSYLYATVDWSGNNSGGFDEVAPDVAQLIANECTKLRQQKIAVTRFDVVGHSQGGVAAAWYICNFGATKMGRSDQFPVFNFPADMYLRPNNFGVGDIRRFISIDSPFNGSPIADAAVSAWFYPAIKNMLFGYNIGLLTLGDEPVTGDACCVYDLQSQSEAIKKMQNADPLVQWFPIVGIDASAVGANDGPKVSLTGAMADLAASAAAVAQNGIGLPANGSDLVVTAASQADTQSVTPGPILRGYSFGVSHTEVEGAPGTIALVSDLLDLDASVSTPGYTRFNPRF